MTKRERIAAACAGKPVDRTPYSLWYHFHLDPPAGEGMARAELDFYHRYDPDLFKVMHDIPYEMPPDLPQVQTLADWKRLPVLDGVSGHFGAQLATIRQILAGRGDDAPVVDTIFSAYATAQHVCGNRTLEFLRSDPDAVHAGLRQIAASLAHYAKALIANGADGIYLAIAGAASDTMDAQEYRQHFLAYDQQVLDAAAGATTNVVHHHGTGIYPDLILGLRGFHIYSWSDRLAGNPSIQEIGAKTQACLMAGVDETTFGQAAPEEITRQAREAIAAARGHGFIVAPGCAVPTPPASSDANLKAIRAAVMG
ncbi:MAG TPA: uroporphyrinogen decarboxylase family protein [Chthonomonadaceae bacterium]|nr:uroporphyrinogen decarboxylase family protein [Chthonomonadaceae bacterium]